MIVSDIMTRIKRQFGDESGVQIVDADIIRWVNDGQRQLVMQNEGILEQIGYASTVAAQQNYSLPADLLILRTVHLKDPNSASYFNIKYYAFNEFDQLVDGWDQTAVDRGYPMMYTIYAGQIRLFPLPDTGQTNGLKIYYNRSPVDVIDATSTIDIPVLYHEVLVKYCLQQAYEMDEEFDKAEAKFQQMSTDIAMLRGRSEWQKQDVYPTITVLAEDEIG